MILAIDGHSLLYRAYFALPDSIRDHNGRPVNAIHGFVGMLARLLKEHRPSDAFVAYDSPWPTLRHAAFPEYKANRAALPEELLAQVPMLQSLLRRTGIPGFAVPGYEGDDILASLAEKCVAQRVPAIIVTGDRDLFQLVRDPWIRVLYTRRGVSGTQVLDEAGVEQLVGVTPARYADLAALRGDPADNLPGIEGIGEKSALAIIAHAPSFEYLYDHLEGLPRDLEKKLVAGRDILFSNRELMRPLIGVPVDWDAQSLTLKIDTLEARAAFGELGLSKACDALLSAGAPPTLPRAASDLCSYENVGELLLHTQRVSLVGCSGEKVEAEAKAEDLYVSDRFRRSRKWAELAGGHWYILSGEHGLVSPETSLRPYDKSLEHASQQVRENWADRVVSQLVEVAAPPALVFLLAGSPYSDPVYKRLTKAGYRVGQPLEGMSSASQVIWLDAALDLGRESADLEEFYEILTRLADHAGGHTLLAEADRRRWPERGVYFFFESGENRFFSAKARVVRVGTHAVSANSKATLWNRLRTHRGVADGGGNHRSSIFRSHVGAAILQRDSRLEEYPAWGDQSTGTADNKSLESELEKLVSATISQMRILCLEIRDSPGPRSDRAFIERNAIALLSKAGSRIDIPSDAWLGRSSIHPTVRKSGLWNVNYVDEPSWDPAFLEVFDYYVRATTGRAPFVDESIAPWGWWNRAWSRDQMNFQWSGTDDAG
jgi:5'-3' exonuclease